MIQSVTPEHYPTLLSIQSDAIAGLTDTYPPDQLTNWINYIQAESSNRYAKYQNLAYWEDGQIQGFISWSIDGINASIECLYVSEPYRGKGIGRVLLSVAENKLAGKTVYVRSTLNARTFYENRGYIFRQSDVSRAGFSIACLDKIL